MLIKNTNSKLPIILYTFGLVGITLILYFMIKSLLPFLKALNTSEPIILSFEDSPFCNASLIFLL